MTIKKKPAELFQYDDDIYNRMGEMEKDVSSLNTRVDGLSENVNRMGKNIFDRLDDLTRAVANIKDNSKPDLKAWASWASVILCVVSVVGSMAITPILADLAEHKNIEGHVPTLKAQAITHVKQQRTDKELDKLELRIKDMFLQFDTMLQREMRLLDEVLQREMALGNKIQDVQIDELKKGMDWTRGWALEHDQTVMGINTGQTKRLDALDRRLEDLMDKLNSDNHFLMDKINDSKDRMDMFDEEQRRRTQKVYSQ